MTRFAASDQEDRSLKYENRIVAFIDILGFADRVTASQENAESIADIYRILTRQKGGLRDEDFRLQFGLTAEITVFSDTIIISEIAQKCYLPRFLQSVGKIQARFLEMGFPLRGGIAIGPLIHNPSVILGPALIEAYEIEKSIAIYPRIVLSQSLFVECASIAGKSSRSDGKYHVRLCREQDDGSLWIEYGHYLSNECQMHGRRRSVNRHDRGMVSIGSIPEIDYCIEAIGEEVLKYQKFPRILKKMEWLYRHLLQSKALADEIEPLLEKTNRAVALQNYRASQQVPTLVISDSSAIDPPPYVPLPEHIGASEEFLLDLEMRKKFHYESTTVSARFARANKHKKGRAPLNDTLLPDTDATPD